MEVSAYQKHWAFPRLNGPNLWVSGSFAVTLSALDDTHAPNAPDETMCRPCELAWARGH